MMPMCCARRHTRVFNEVYAHRRWDLFARVHLRAYQQLAAVAREHLIALRAHPAAAGADERMFLDIDSLLRPVYGRQAGRPSVMPRSPAALLRLGCPTDHHHLHGDRRAGDRRGAATERKAAPGAVPHTSSSRRSPPRKRSTRRADPGARRLNVWHQESDHHLHSARREFSCRSAATSASTPRSPPSTRPLDPGATRRVEDPTPGVDLRCQVAETPTPCAGPRRTLTVRLVVRRVKDAATWMRCFRCGAITRLYQLRAAVDQAISPTDATPSSKHLRRFNRRPLAHIPSGLFAANCAWLACAVIAITCCAPSAPSPVPPCRGPRGYPAPRPDQHPGPLRRRPQTMLHLPATGIGEPDGRPCGTTSSVTDRATRAA
ncbi:transposase, IS4 family [Mycobacterium xenopi 4042]|uniref:Transposase, IS4 family n=1 Tax=Mycobacterium xenopi 4042 TaxID=1299334 RepID=X8DBV7_MYCXE|nr:transposase, IS4 family [Mycobacterium xenopi 4042]